MRRRVEISVDIECDDEREMGEHLDAIRFFAGEISQRALRTDLKIVEPRQRLRPRAPSPLECYRPPRPC